MVATLDSGVDLQHADLGSRWRGGANSWFDPYGEHSAPHDASGHGTQVMGILVGGDASGSSIGMAPGAQWIAARIFDDAGSGTLSGVHAAFQWMLDPDGDPSVDDVPDVVNASWTLLGTVGACNTEFEADINLLRAGDINVVFAGGNFGPGADTSVSPANNAGSLSVGAVDDFQTIASFSSRGPSACSGGLFPQVSAPGADVSTADLTLGGLIPDATLAVSGTSFAAPHVAGALALLRGAFPSASQADVETAILTSAVDLGESGPDDEYGWGLLDVFAAYVSMASTGESTFLPNADARVKSTDPNANFGLLDPLWVDEDVTTYHSYLQFDLSSLAGSVRAARLRLFATNGSADGVEVYAVSNEYNGTATPWSEPGITWANAPLIAGAPIDSLGSVAPNGWIELDVTPAVNAGGILSFALKNSGSDSARFSSREGANPPELRVESSAPVAPVADFEADPVSGSAPLTVGFRDLSTGGPTSFSWDFGDGQVSSLRHPDHVYGTHGTFTVSLTVGNAAGSDATTRTDYITVDVAPAIRTLTPSHDARVRSSTPNVSYGLENPLRVDEDDTVYHSYLKFDAASVTGAVDRATLRLFATNGSADGVSAHAVSNDYGNDPTPWTESGITFANAPEIPPAALDAVPTVSSGSWVELDVTAAVAGGGPVSFGLRNAGPDAARFNSKEGANPPELVIEATAGPPSTDFSASPASGWAPLVVAFTDLSRGGPTSWAWDFGDGTGSSLQHPIHTYSTPGTWTVSLTTTNGYGSDSVTLTGYITTSEPEPPVADFGGAPTTGVGPLTVDFTDQSTGAPTSWLWSFGDGGTSSDPNPSHTYSGAGAYDVSLTVANTAGSNTISKTGFVTVAEPPSERTLAPTEDARVKSSDPNGVFGDEDPLWVDDDSTVYRSYLTFDVPPLGGAVRSAVLRMFATNGSEDGVAIHAVSASYAGTSLPWSETALSWNNAPSIEGPALDSAGSVGIGQWIELDVTAAVQGNELASFGLVGLGSDSARFSSKEGAESPELVIRTQ